MVSIAKRITPLPGKPLRPLRSYSMCRRGLVVFLIAACGILFSQSTAIPQERGISTNRISKIQLSLRNTAECPSNLLLLSDLVQLSGSDSIVHEISDLPIAPAPRVGATQTWNREAIAKALSLRGVAPEAIHWKGSTECVVRRVEGVRVPRAEPSDKPPAIPGSADISAASFQPSRPDENRTANTDAAKIDRSQFTPAFVTPTTVSQAERIVTEAISNYLRTKTNSDHGQWIVKAKVPTEHAKALTQQRHILGVAGGQSPWEGEQEFTLLVKGNNGEQAIVISANVKLPEMVVASQRALAKGYVLKEEDLVWIPMPRGLPYGPEDCYTDISTIVGKQLRKALNTQQVLRLADVGPPTLIHVGDIISIEVIRGSIAVETNGRAVESGGLDDLIQVDVEPHRARVLARVRGDRKAEVIAGGSSKPNTANSNLKPNLRR